MFKLILIIFIFIFLFLLFILATGLFVRFNNSKVYQDIIITIVACLIFIPPSLYLYRDYYNALTLLYNCIFLAIIMSIVFTIYLSICILISEKLASKKL